MATANVIKTLQIKDESGFSSPSCLGAEQYFVSALRGSTINNLEEQFLLGVDCITTSWQTDDGIIRTTKEFHQSDRLTEYYKLEIYDYSNSSGSDKYIAIKPKGGVEGAVLLKTFTPSEDEVDLEEYTNNGNLYFTSNNFSFNEEGNLIVSSQETLLEKEELYYISNSGVSILVAEKQKFRMFDSNNRKVYKEIIINHLI